MTAAPLSPPSAGFVHMANDEGHRQAYLDLFGEMFDLAPSTGAVKGATWSRLLSAEQVFFGTLDDDVWGFTRLALARALRRRKTCGLFLRANSCLDRGLKAKVKWLYFAALKRLPGVSAISIIPFSIMPGIERVANDWVHDPQFWDQVDHPPAVDEAALAAITSAAAGRPVLAFLGGLTESKAFPRLANLYLSSAALREKLLLMVAGKAYRDEIRDMTTALEQAGALVWQRFVSDAEIAAAYRSSAAIWVSYAPGYDQASGIFGRAVQERRPVIVRDDSITIASYVRLLDHPALSLSADDAQAGEQLLKLGALLRDGGASADDNADLLRQWRDRFVEIISRALV
jgi:hypothetical protein